MDSVTQINLTLPNQPNSLSRIGDTLRSHQVNIDAISCSEGSPDSTVHMVVSDPEVAAAALAELGSVVSERVLRFSMKNKPGAIGNIGRALGASDVNIRNMFATTYGTDATVYVAVDDVDKAVAGMQSWKDDGGTI